MSRTQPDVDVTGDAELIAAVRGGDLTAYGDLFERHVLSARRLARQLTNASDADDLVSDAFAKVLRVLQGGGGPDLAFRAYLLTAIRRLHIDRIRADSRLKTTDDMEPFDPGIPFRDTAVEGFENAAAAKAFASLPERWQMVLWHTEVEGQKPAEVAALLGMSANSVSALAYRAREGLRQAFLTSHAQDIEDEGCRWTNDHLGAYVRKALARRDTVKVENHLDECRRCMAIYLELNEVNSGLGALLAPLLLGSAGAAYAAATGGAALKGGVLLLFGRARDLVVANSQVAAVTGAAAVATAAGITFAVATNNSDPVGPPPRAEIVATQSAEPGPSPTADREPRDRRTPRERAPVAPPVLPSLTPTNEAPVPVEQSTEPAAPSTSAEPSQQPSQTPTDEPSQQPSETPTTDEPSETPTEQPTTLPPELPDLQLAVTVQRSLLSARLTATALGIPPGQSAQLTIQWHGLVLGQLPAACRVVRWHTAVCTVDADRPVLSGRATRIFGGSVSMSLAPIGFKDSDPGNNTWSWTGR